MSTQPKALEFAEHLENYGEFQSYFDDVAEELRRLHAENQKLKTDLLVTTNSLKEMADFYYKASEYQEMARKAVSAITGKSYEES